jgi:phosphatidylglycerophosphate synthase
LLSVFSDHDAINIATIHAFSSAQGHVHVQPSYLASHYPERTAAMILVATLFILYQKLLYMVQSYALPLIQPGLAHVHLLRVYSAT